MAFKLREKRIAYDICIAGVSDKQGSHYAESLRSCVGAIL